MKICEQNLKGKKEVRGKCEKNEGAQIFFYNVCKLSRKEDRAFLLELGYLKTSAKNRLDEEMKLYKLAHFHSVPNSFTLTK